jgi:hypothetical protein
VLEERNWTFATDRKATESTDLDGWGQLYKHSIPLGWMSVFRAFRNVNDPGSELTSDDWRREGDFILARETKLYLWGIQRVTDTGKFSSLFVQALAQRIAADGAMFFTENVQLEGHHWQKYAAKLEEAAVRDGQQGSNEKVRSEGYINARARGAYPR